MDDYDEVESFAIKSVARFVASGMTRLEIPEEQREETIGVLARLMVNRPLLPYHSLVVETELVRRGAYRQFLAASKEHDDRSRDLPVEEVAEKGLAALDNEELGMLALHVHGLELLGEFIYDLWLAERICPDSWTVLAQEWFRVPVDSKDCYAITYKPKS